MIKIEELKALLSEVTVTVTKTRGKQEITFSFENKVPVQASPPDPIMDTVIAAATGLKSKDGEEVFVVKKEASEPGEIKKEELPIADVILEQSKTKEEVEEKETIIIQDCNGNIEEIPVIENKTPIGSTEVPKEVEQKVDEKIATKEEASVERTEAQIKRINILAGMLFKEKDNQFVNSGIGVSTKMILNCTDDEFNKAIAELKAHKNTVTDDKPTKSFSDFQAESIEFPEEEEKEEVIKETPKPAAAPAPPKPVAKASPLEEKCNALIASKDSLSLEEYVNGLAKAFEEEGYGMESFNPKEYTTKESVTDMINWLKENPLKTI